MRIKRQILRILTLLLALAALAFAQPALAGDTALSDPIGYSRDGNYFAYEEFGIAHGTGFAYSNIYVIDLHQDVWVVGTPIREVGDTAEMNLGTVRTRARARARQVLSDLEIDRPAVLLAANGDSAPGVNEKMIRFGLPPGPSQDVTHRTVRGDFALTLSTFETAAGSPCEQWFGTNALGFRLEQSASGATRTLFVDGVLPRSRGCPAAYGIYAVYAPFASSDVGAAVALISVYDRGFEGYDRRFLAQPLNESGKP